MIFNLIRGTFVFLSFLIICLLIACKSSKENYIVNLELEKKIILPIPDEVLKSQKYLNTYPYVVKFIENNKQLLVNFYQFNYLFVYDLKTYKIINKISFPITFNFDNVEYINKDSIIMFLSGVYKYYYDTSIVVMNNEGKIKKSYGIIHENVLSSSTFDINNLNEKTFFNSLFPLFNFDNVVYKNRTYFALNCSHDKFKENNIIPVYGYYDFLKNTVVIDKYVTYPIKKPIVEFNYPENIFKNHINVIPEKNELLISFAFSPYVYKIELDYEEKKIILLNSKLPDTSWIYKSTKVDYLFMYGKVSYIKSLKKYIRLVSLKLNDDIFYSLVSYDENFNYLGEQLVTHSFKNINNTIFYSEIENNSLVINLYKPKNIFFDTVKFNNELKKLFKPLSKNEICKFALGKPIHSKNVLNFLKSKQSDSTFAALILNANGCSPCNEYFIEFLSLNSFLLNKKKNPLSFVYITNDKISSENYFKKKKINNAIIDEPKNYNSYHPFKHFNPRLVLVKNNKVISDTIYMPDQTEKLVERLLEFYGIAMQ